MHSSELDGDRFSALGDLSSDAILTFDREHRVTSFNRAAERLYGIPATAVLGREPSPLGATEPWLEQHAVLERVLTGETVPSFETNQARADGELTPVTMAWTPVIDAGGAVVEALAVVRDITVEHGEREALATAEEQLRRTFDETRVGMFIADRDGRHIRINDAFCRMVGRPYEELINTDFEAITHPDDVAENRALSELISSTSQSSHVRQKRYIRPDGRIVWVEVRGTMVRDADGRQRYAVGQVVDITERREQEERLRDLVDHDPLTGALNRRGFNAVLDAQLAQADRHGTPGALLLIDLDNFKRHNDRYGHTAGDELLIAVAHRLKSRLRLSDSLARIGGDEFAVVLPYADRDRAHAVSVDLMDRIRETSAELAPTSEHPVTASLGIACFDTDSKLSPAQIISNADGALYAAKAQGRDRISHHQRDPGSTAGAARGIRESDR